MSKAGNAGTFEYPGERQPLGPATGDRRCQWCAAVLPASSLRCPACGSPVASADVDVLSGDPATGSTPANGMPARTNAQTPRFGTQHDAWAVPERREPGDPADLLKDDRPASGRGSNSNSTMLMVAGGIVLFCLLFGALVLPYLIVGPFEDLTGIDDAKASNMRGLGALIGTFAGLLLAMGFGAISWGTRAMRN